MISTKIDTNDAHCDGNISIDGESCRLVSSAVYNGELDCVYDCGDIQPTPNPNP